MGAPGTAQSHAVVRSPSHRGGRHGPRHHSRVARPSEWKRVGGWGLWELSHSFPRCSELDGVPMAPRQTSTHWPSARPRAPPPPISRSQGTGQLDARNPLPPALINPLSQPLQNFFYHPPSQIPPSQPNGSLPSNPPNHDHTPFNTKSGPSQPTHPRSSSHGPRHKGPPGVPQGRDRHTYIHRDPLIGRGTRQGTYPLSPGAFSRKVSARTIPRPVQSTSPEGTCMASGPR